MATSRYLVLFLLGTTLLIETSCGAPVTTDTQAMMYLSQFGYFNSQMTNLKSGAMISADSMKAAISEFQAFAGLNITGELDQETARTMSLPRCGVRDKVGYASDSRSKRYALQGSRWKVKELSYRISKYPNNLSAKKVDAEIEKALKMWSEVSGLTFVKKSRGPVHIDIRFEKGEHGDGDPFDGPGGTLAHAYFPVYGGDVHFDDAETWSVNSYAGTNLFQVAVHDLGHSLGLSHSDVRTAIMAPFYRGYEPYHRLDLDDIQGIQALYGKSSTKAKIGSKLPTITTSTESPNVVEEHDELCNSGSVDTIFNSATGVTYVFKGALYWELTENGVAPGYPRLISDNWPGLPSHIDAAFTYRNGKTYFFKGSQYWRFVDTKMDDDYPKLTSEGFRGIPDNVDAAFVWSGNGKIYFFKGTRFWRYDPSYSSPVKITYPKPVSNWEGVPDHLDAAVQYTNGYTYFFKQGQYYRFNDGTFSVDFADPPFPRSVSYWWFGCNSESNGGNHNNNGWFLSGSYPSLSEVSDGDDSQIRSLRVQTDPLRSDVDDLILDAGDDNHPRDETEFAAARMSGSRSLGMDMVIVMLTSLLVFTRNCLS